jgi:hypothetical protein
MHDIQRFLVATIAAGILSRVRNCTAERRAGRWTAEDCPRPYLPQGYGHPNSREWQGLFGNRQVLL